jgi:hypothetical protein
MAVEKQRKYNKVAAWEEITSTGEKVKNPDPAAILRAGKLKNISVLAPVLGCTKSI